MRRVMDFYASWCGPCKLLGQQLDVLENSDEKYSNSIERVDIEDNETLVSEYSIRNVPTVIFLEDGVEQSRKSGLILIDEIKSFLDGEEEEAN